MLVHVVSLIEAKSLRIRLEAQTSLTIPLYPLTIPAQEKDLNIRLISF